MVLEMAARVVGNGGAIKPHKFAPSVFYPTVEPVGIAAGLTRRGDVPHPMKRVIVPLLGEPAGHVEAGSIWKPEDCRVVAQKG